MITAITPHGRSFWVYAPEGGSLHGPSTEGFARAFGANLTISGPPKSGWARSGPFPFKNGLFLVYSTIAQIRCKFNHFGPQKGRWARNGPFPFKNGLFLVYSTIAESRCKFDHFGPPKERMGQKRSVSIQKRLGLQRNGRNSMQT